MSLREFHILFIVVSIAVCLGFGWWCLSNAGGSLLYMLLGVSSFGLGFGLVLYGRLYFKKLRELELGGRDAR